MTDSDRMRSRQYENAPILQVVYSRPHLLLKPENT